MKDQSMFYLRLLGTFNLALTIYRVVTFKWGHGTHDHVVFHPNQCPPIDGTSLVFIHQVFCLLYNTKRSFKILWGIRSFFTLALFVKRIRSSKSCYGFWFISTIAELCIKVYLVQNGYLDPPGFLQLIIELIMVYLLTTLLATSGRPCLGSGAAVTKTKRFFIRNCCNCCSASCFPFPVTTPMQFHSRDNEDDNLQELV